VSPGTTIKLAFIVFDVRNINKIKIKRRLDDEDTIVTDGRWNRSTRRSQHSDRRTRQRRER
jgi:hypothetical protein